LAGFVIGVIIARTLGTESVGVYAKVVTLAYMLQFVGDMGTNLWLVRRVSREPDSSDKALGSVLLCKLMLSVPMLGIILLCGWLLGYSGTALELLPLGGLVVAVFLLSETGFVFLQASGRNTLQGIIQTTMGVLTMTAPLIWISLGFNLTLQSILIFQLLAQMFSLCWSSIMILRAVKPRLGVNPFALIRESHWFLWQYVALMIHTQLIIVVVGSVMNDGEVGHFRVAQQLVAAIFLFSVAAFYAANPSLQRASLGSTEGLQQLHRLLIRFLTTMGLPMSVILLVFAPQILRILYGEAFVDAASILRWMSFSVVFRFLTHSSDGVLMAAGRVRLWLMLSMIPLLLDVIVIWPLAIFFGGDGAAIGFTLTEGLLAVAVVWVTARIVGNTQIFSDTIAPIAAAILMGTTLWLLGTSAIFVSVPLGVSSFILALFVIRYLNIFPNRPVPNAQGSASVGEKGGDL
jgi:O-antigen/teichoic acid export membrane protein